MTFPPSLLRVRIRTRRRRIGLWLPLILLWLPALVLALLVLPFVLFAAALLWRRGIGGPLLLAGPRLFLCFCGLRGLEVKIRQPSRHVLVYFR